MSDIIIPGAEEETPAYDFGSGELKEKVDELRAKLGLDVEEDLTPEAMMARNEAAQGTEDECIRGSDIDWDDYELDSQLAHLYPRAEFRNTPQGPRWLVKMMEFVSESKQFLNHNIGKNGEPLGVGEYLTYMINSREGWQIGSITPNGTGMAGIILQRQVTVTLPDPVEVVKETVVAAPTDEELAATETASLEWANQEEKDGESVSNEEAGTKESV